MVAQVELPRIEGGFNGQGLDLGGQLLNGALVLGGQQFLLCLLFGLFGIGNGLDFLVPRGRFLHFGTELDLLTLVSLVELTVRTQRNIQHIIGQFLSGLRRFLAVAAGM